MTSGISCLYNQTNIMQKLYAAATFRVTARLLVSAEYLSLSLSSDQSTTGMFHTMKKSIYSGYLISEISINIYRGINSMY